MIVFDLRCDAGHVFEAWFGSTTDYDAQRARGLVACPICGTPDIAKAAMAPAVPAKGNSLPASPPKSRPVPMQSGTPSLEAMKAMMTALAQAQAKALETSEHVGRRFAEEARAIHEGEAPDRIIHGEASLAEAKALIDDGVPVAPLPFPVVPPRQVQ